MSVEDKKEIKKILKKICNKCIISLILILVCSLTYWYNANSLIMGLYVGLTFYICMIIGLLIIFNFDKILFIILKSKIGDKSKFIIIPLIIVELLLFILFVYIINFSPFRNQSSYNIDKIYHTNIKIIDGDKKYKVYYRRSGQLGEHKHIYIKSSNLFDSFETKIGSYDDGLMNEVTGLKTCNDIFVDIHCKNEEETIQQIYLLYKKSNLPQTCEVYGYNQLLGE